ncbi:RNA-directed DNA polymerase from mobile element jockey [Eumeta japonica]|uniref:RNA-directed DNA polymerase from mobile element jockey n=1 Tax=Eumeta variegata TaxID=151549 RepID=A0A4C1YVZ2_EUMVA|nr:RNA-directed DNA polymerase from mobile element jockey [Eumeta japonica]
MMSVYPLTTPLDLRLAREFSSLDVHPLERLLEEISPSHVAYWSVVKALKSDGYEATPALKKPDNTYAFDDREKAKSTCIEEEVKQKATLPRKDDLPPVSLNEVQRHIRKLKTIKAPGLDGINIWKEAVIIGIPKTETSRPPSSYRPISLRSGLDVAKAFDKVWHSGLTYKLYQLEVPDRLVLLVQNYLKNRHFTFRHENKFLSKRLIRAGVAQGSTLPLLYSSYTNDIPWSQKGVQLALFADDTALYLRGISFRSITPRLQRAIDELTQWFQTWRIECLLMPIQKQLTTSKYYRTDSAKWLLAHPVVINRCASRTFRRPKPRAQFILKPSRDSYAEEPSKGTHRIITRCRHLHAGLVA